MDDMDLKMTENENVALEIRTLEKLIRQKQERIRHLEQSDAHPAQVAALNDELAGEIRRLSDLRKQNAHDHLDGNSTS